MGTTKLICLIGAIENKQIRILGYGYKESKGIVSGAISDMKLAQDSITRVINEAEKMAGMNIDNVIINLTGNYVVSHKSDITSKINYNIIRNSDINQIVNNIRDQYRKNNREIIHLIPLQYKIDGSSTVQNPRQMAGKSLFCRFHIISTPTAIITNIANCLKKCQLSINNYLIESYAAALGALNENEKNFGTLVIDVGGENSSYCLIVDDKLIHSGNFSVGGSHITRDISAILNINFETAEKN